MFNTVFLSLGSLVYILLIGIVYFLKPKLMTVENKIYKSIMVVTICSLISETSLLFYNLCGLDTNALIYIILMKIYFVFCFSWVAIFLVYVYVISKKKQKDTEYHFNKMKLFYILFYILSILLISALPVYYLDTETEKYAYGPSVNFVLGSLGLFLLIIIIFLIINRKNLKQKQYYPIISFVIIFLFIVIIQKINPSLLLVNSALSFITALMYFTIENPDLKMIEQLNIARDQADRANTAKSEFLSSMSHEIRTPLNAVVGFSQALSEEDLPYQAKEEVKDIMMACDTLLDIVNGILDISKIEANKLEIVNTEYNFNLILDELVSLSKARLGEKPLDFRYQFSPDLPKYMYGDKLRVKQVILNLLTNAIKYTHEGYIEFKVNCIKKGDVCRLIISVQDSGIGIKPESIDKLFNRFERLDVEKNNTIEGTGLGLAITKKLIGLMGGQIVVQSVYGEGSKFTIALDQRIVETPTDPNLEKTQALDLSAVKDIDLTNKRILVVDDNKINLKVAARLLQDYHCIVDTLESGIECIEKIKMGASYNLILMDDMMPKMSGTETFHKLQEIEGFNTPVISLTANAISGMREKYLAEGFSDYLSKPIDKTELNRVLNKFLGE